MIAYVLVQTDGTGPSIAARLQAIPGVLAAEDLSGAYDAIALAQAGSTRFLFDDVVTEILKLPGVTRALPAPVIGSPSQRPRGEGRGIHASAQHEAA